MALIQLVCNCPDAQKRAAKNPNSFYLAENIGRDWSYSNAGIDPDQLCKHSWAVILASGRLKEIGIPNDPAIPHVERKTTKTLTPRLQSDISKGDYFGS